MQNKEQLEFDAQRMYWEFVQEHEGKKLPFSLDDAKTLEGIQRFTEAILPVPDRINPLIRFVMKKRDEQWKAKVRKLKQEIEHIAQLDPHLHAKVYNIIDEVMGTE